MKGRTTLMRLSLLAVTLSFILFTHSAFRKKTPTAEQKIELGRQLFFDKALSEPNGQSCTVCHAPKTAFSDPNHAIVSEGMIDGAFVNRNSQSLAYVSFIPTLQRSANGEYYGGLFWDGRSSSLTHQLSGPFFNPAEMNNADTLSLLAEVKQAPYYSLFKQVYGRIKDPDIAYDQLCEAIAAFESSSVFNEFTSKYDYYLAGKVELTEQEKLGLSLFEGKGRCNSCHLTTPEPESGRVLFTNFHYYNLGIPRNPKNPFYSTFASINPQGEAAFDYGLGAVVNDVNQNGKFRVPTLRNVQYTGPYFHNGYCATLEEAVHFLNARDVDAYPAPEVRQNVAHQITGSSHLKADEEQAIVAFLLCLTDGYEPQ
jgi:cytochrome c peroxidase